MPNDYSNQANNIPPSQSGIAVGQKVQTIYGLGTITSVHSKFHYGDAASKSDPLIVTIVVPGNPPVIFQEYYSRLLFTGGAVGGELSAQSEYKSNL